MPSQFDSNENTRQGSPLCLEVPVEHDGDRLDAFLVDQCNEISRSKLQTAILSGDVSVDGKKSKPAYRLKTGQVVLLSVPRHVSSNAVPEDIPLDILFEDESIVAINKPAGMVVHPAKGHWSGTLTSALAFRFKELSQVGGETRPGIVHRLDRDTSGVILVAKTDASHMNLALQFEKRTVEKKYMAVVSPAPDRDRDIIDQPIGVHPYQREKMAIRSDHKTSRSASTFYEVVERLGSFAVVEVSPKTGRTHQIRVHLSHIGCPVVCDRLYSGRSRMTIGLLKKSDDPTVILERQALHARQISFDNPITGERMTVGAPVADDIELLIDTMRVNQ